MRFSFTFTTTIALVSAASTLAYGGSAGASCTNVGAKCDGTNGNPSSFGYCAPDGVCGDNGATCTVEGDCYNYCGQGVCGGQGAQCNTQASFRTGQFDVARDTPTYTCSANGDIGTCSRAATMSQRARAKKRRAALPGVNAVRVDSITAESEIKRGMRE